MKFLTYTLLLLSALSLVVAGCNSVGCTENQNSVPLAGFYSYSTFAKIAPDSVEIGGVGAPNDSLLVTVRSRVNQVYLPFRSIKPSTSFYIAYRQKALDYRWLNDTLTFTYESIPYFASQDCGAMYHYKITNLSYTTHLIDSVGISDSLITNVELERIQIYFRTNDPTQTEQ